MTATASKHEGTWRRLANLSAERKGSIHDDDAARSLGFQAAFVPGSTVATSAMPGLVRLLGRSWFEGGWYTFKFVSPVYTSEDVREEAEAAGDGRIGLRVVTRDGRLCCSGQAGLGFETPWDLTPPARPGVEEALAGVEVGTRFDETPVEISEEYIARLLGASGDATPWYQAESPFGGALIPPETLHNFALQVTRTRRLPITGVRNPGMWAEHSLAISRPLFLEAGRYSMREWVADKGLSGRAVYLTYEFEVVEGADVVARGQHKVKWLRE